MRRMSLASPALLVLSLVACGAPAPAEPTRPARSAPATNAGAAQKQEDAQPDSAARPDDDMAAMLAKVGGELRANREIAEAYAAGKLGDRLLADEMLLVDAKAPAGTDQVNFFLVNGALPTPPAKIAELRAGKGSVREILHGGEDGDRPGLFRGVEPGTYTVCAVVGPKTSAEKKAFLDKVEAAYRAEAGGAEAGDKLDPEKLRAVLAKVEAETSYEPQEPDWDALPLRCKQAEVTAAADSRVVVLDG